MEFQVNIKEEPVENFNYLQNSHDSSIIKDDCDIKTEIKEELNYAEVFNYSTEELECTVCQRIFESEELLKTHIKTHIVPIEEHNGSSLVKNSALKKLSRQHHLSLDEPVNLYKCEICFKCFTSKSVYQRHKRLHGERPNKCKVCFKSFLQPTSLRVHMRTHTGERPYVCDICSKAFAQSGGLQVHLKIHTGESPYVCEICSKGFKAKGNFQIHMRTHTGERPFVCCTCYKTFTRREYLQSHLLLHTGERPFQCQVCSKNFIQLRSLQLHMLNHKGERPYLCEICSKTFTTNAVLKVCLKNLNATQAVTWELVKSLYANSIK